MLYLYQLLNEITNAKRPSYKKGEILLDLLLAQFFSVGVFLYGFITLFLEITKKSKRSKNQIGLSIALIVSGTSSFFLTIN